MLLTMDRDLPDTIIMSKSFYVDISSSNISIINDVIYIEMKRSSIMMITVLIMILMMISMKAEMNDNNADDN